MGYKEFMLELFGENILFVDGKHQWITILGAVIN